jgi:hypothetical protein
MSYAPGITSLDHSNTFGGAAQMRKAAWWRPLLVDKVLILMA